MTLVRLCRPCLLALGHPRITVVVGRGPWTGSTVHDLSETVLVGRVHVPVPCSFIHAMHHKHERLGLNLYVIQTLLSVHE